MVGTIFIHLSIAAYMMNSIVPSHGNDITSFNVRQLQTAQTLNYRAKYKAGFSHLTHTFCSGPPPQLQVSCYGTQMSILNTSDPTIICTQLATAEITNGTTYECQNTCQGSTCTSIFGTGNFGSIEFMCEGNDYEQVAARYVYLDGPDGQCDASSDTSTFNVHMARIGVSCPTTTGSEYFYDDTYSECPGRVESALDLAEDNENDIYACVSGDNCEGQSCVVNFRSIVMETSVRSFLDTCVESLNVITTFPTHAPIVPEGTLLYTAQFEASWANFYSSLASIDACTVANPSIDISCGNGATIAYLNSTDLMMNCIVSGSAEMTCTGNVAALQNKFTNVIYECTGRSIPTTQVRYPESAATCSNNIVDTTLSHAVTLGVFCDAGGEQQFTYLDAAVECYEASHNFDISVEENRSTFYGYICSESSTFTIGSTASQTIRSVSIITDQYWLNNPPDGCVAISDGTTATSQPTMAPINQRSLTPTIGDNIPTGSPIESPSGSISTPQPNTPIAQDLRVDSKGNYLGIVIGCVGGGFALAAAIGIVIYLRKQDKRGVTKSSSTFHTDSNTGDDFTASTPHPSTVTEIPTARQRDPMPYTNSSDTNRFHEPKQHQSISKSNPNIIPTSRPKRPSSSNYVVQHKDQCRSVAVRASSPTLSTYASLQSENIPFVVAVGVNTTSSTTSEKTVKREPPGRFDEEQ